MKTNSRPQPPARHRAPAVLAAAALAWAFAGTAAAGPLANSTVPGALTVYTTRLCAGFEWQVTGDDNGNCAVAVEYRRAGTADWRPAQPLMRVEHGLWTHGEDPGNLLAGSLFFLQPGVSYEARLTLSDPDGGSDQRILPFVTRTESRAAATRTLYVVPGSGGGTGSVGDPFRGLAAADAAAQPGDLFLLQPGTYHGRFDVTRNGTAALPITYRGTGPLAVVLDADGSSNSAGDAVRLTGRRHVLLESVGLRNGQHLVVADSSTGVVVRGCILEQLLQPVGAHGIRAAVSTDLTVEGNVIRMPGSWATIGRTGTYGTGGYAILVEGSGHVICHNRIEEAWDAISIPVTGTGVPAVITRNVDIYENDIDRASDDGIQADAVHHNVRIFHNRLVNTGSGVSFQPCFGGPGYVLWNEMFNNRIEPFKFHQETFYGWTQETSGFIVAHNTSVESRNAWYESGIWRNGWFRNNLMLGARAGTYSLYAGYTYPGARFDHDGWNRAGGYATLVRFSGSSYADLPAFYAGTGNEQHGREVTPAVFQNGPLPHDPQWDPTDGYGAAYTPADFDLRLAPGATAVDAGATLPNLDDDYLGAAPDLGCHEAGDLARSYGPQSGAVTPLVAIQAAPVSAQDSTTIRFLGGARAADRLLVGLHWDFGDGQAADDTRRPVHAYVQPGSYDVRLTATTENGDVGIGSVTLDVGGSGGGNGGGGDTLITPPPGVALALRPPVPNPSHGAAQLGFELPATATVQLAVFDVRGTRVRTLVSRAELAAGPHAVTWDGTRDDGREAGTGVYWVRLEAGSASRTRKLVLLR